MARALRLQISGLTQHVIQRGNNRIEIFRSPSDFAFFLAALYTACTRYLLDVHAYALMTNHFHLLATPRTTTSISETMRAIGPKYVRYFNRKYARTGTLYEGRYRSCVIDTDVYWLTCMRYVELNPLRAGLVSQPDAYRWSSYAANAFGMPDKLIVPHPLYMSLGQSPQIRQQSWRSICGEVLTTEQLTEIRCVTHRGGVLGVTSEALDIHAKA
jgi:putative transposase